MGNGLYLDERVKKYLANIDLQKMQEDASNSRSVRSIKYALIK